MSFYPIEIRSPLKQALKNNALISHFGYGNYHLCALMRIIALRGIYTTARLQTDDFRCEAFCQPKRTHKKKPQPFSRPLQRFSIPNVILKDR